MDNNDELPMWVIYFNPSDYPDKYIARKWIFDNPTNEILIADSITAIRNMLPRGLYRIPSSTYDDPVIVETWI